MPQLIINTYVSLMYELKKNGKVFTSKFVGTGPSFYEKRIYQAADLTKVEKHWYSPQLNYYTDCAIPSLKMW